MRSFWFSCFQLVIKDSERDDTKRLDTHRLIDMDSSSSTSAAATEQAGGSSAGPAGLGSMSSLSAECTPLKHKYDGCFNLWFQEYLGIPSDSSAGGEGSVSAAAGSSASPERKRRFWGGGGPSKDVSGETGATPGVTMSAAEATTKRAQLRDDLEGRCGALFREYQTCVKVRMLID